MCMTHIGHETHSSRAEEDPVKILKLRLAKGEITPQEYEQLRALPREDREEDRGGHGH